MNYGDVCTGLSAATVAWHPLGWRPAFFSEIEPFPCKLLKHHYPDVPNLGDMTKLLDNQTFINAVIDLLVGGTPCQSFSLAGLRGGLADDRGNLALWYCRLLIAKRPRWFVWENVPGVLNSFSGEASGDGVPFWETADFATLLTAFRECGYSVCWRVLDSQFFGVPQRRRRVFIVGHLGDDWRPPAAVLLEQKGVRGHNSPVKKAKQDVAGTINASNGKSRGAGIDPGLIIPCWWDGGQISQTLDAVLYKGQTMPEKNRFPAVLWAIKAQNGGKDYKAKLADVASPLETRHRFGNQGGDVIQTDLSVRRLTPLECERLQGFPDHYTAIPGAADGPRYKALGNSMTTHVMHWIGSRIQQVDKILKL